MVGLVGKPFLPNPPVTKAHEKRGPYPTNRGQLMDPDILLDLAKLHLRAAMRSQARGGTLDPGTLTDIRGMVMTMLRLEEDRGRS